MVGAPPGGGRGAARGGGRGGGGGGRPPAAPPPPPPPDPVFQSVSDRAATLRRTGSSACAEDDGWGRGYAHRYILRGG
ncbi:hypothetical protein P3G22_07015 [Rhodopseudomonas sp. BAL398]|nr:hypothetical protein [Rhodopseudomonas sp. BAL398]